VLAWGVTAVAAGFGFAALVVVAEAPDMPVT
jgi:hypothetical protein